MIEGFGNLVKVEIDDDANEVTLLANKIDGGVEMVVRNFLGDHDILLTERSAAYLAAALIGMVDSEA